MSATPTRSDGARRREELLDAALQCFSECGVLGTGIEEIRRRAGASPSSVYHNFTDLEHLACALLDRTFRRAITHVEARVLGTATGRDAVIALVDSYLEWAFGHPDEARFMYQALALELSGARRDEVRTTKADVQAPLFAHLMTLAAAGELPDWPSPILNSVLLGVAHDACRRHLDSSESDIESTVTWMRATLPELAWRAVSPDCSPRPK